MKSGDRLKVTGTKPLLWLLGRISSNANLGIAFGVY